MNTFGSVNPVMSLVSIGGSKSVCILGAKGTCAANSCDILMRAMASPDEEVDPKINAVGADFDLGNDVVIKATTKNQEVIEMLRGFLSCGSINIDPFEAEGFSGFSISRA